MVIMKNLFSSKTTEVQAETQSTGTTENGSTIQNREIEKGEMKNVQKTKTSKDKKRKLKIFLLILLGLVILLAGAGGLAAIQAKTVMSEAQKTIQSAREVYDAGKNQDLVTANQKLEEVKTNLTQTQKRFRVARPRRQCLLELPAS